MSEEVGTSRRFVLCAVVGFMVLGIVAVSVLYLGMIEPFIEAAQSLPTPQ